MFDDVEFIGLGASQDATLTVDYETDKVTVSLGQRARVRHDQRGHRR
jgi:hypothetical protein